MSPERGSNGTTGALKNRLARLLPGDRNLLIVAIGLALAALELGIVAGLMTALARGGIVAIEPDLGYRFLTVHGVAAFFYWLSLAQTALLLGFAAAEGGKGLAWRPAAMAGVLLIALGFGASLIGTDTTTPLLYDGAPGLVADQPSEVLPFNLGYLLLGLGLMVAPMAAIATLLRHGGKGDDNRLSAVGFALFAWAGFLMVSGFAAIHAFLPGMLWALGLGAFPAAHTTNWHILFHNMHYLPLMATVLMWYVLVRELTGVASIFGETFSKIVFSMYLVFVPPTSLYHMFLEPDLPNAVRVAGSLLSLFVSVPTLTAFLIIIASLEVSLRAQGGRGMFGWLRLLPWRRPAMTAIGLAVVNMAFGLVLAFVLIQEKLAPLLSDTFFVPGYFHFFTVGTVTLTLLAALTVLLPALTGSAIVAPGVLRLMPWLTSIGLLVFGVSGVAAGYLGVPRRVIDVAYGGEAPALWRALMGIVGVGGAVMATALAVFAAGVAVSLFPRRTARPEPREPSATLATVGISSGTAALIGPASVLIIVAGMYVFTIVAFELLKSLPLVATGGGAH